MKKQVLLKGSKGHSDEPELRGLGIEFTFQLCVFSQATIFESLFPYL